MQGLLLCICVSIHMRCVCTGVCKRRRGYWQMAWALWTERSRGKIGTVMNFSSSVWYRGHIYSVTVFLLERSITLLIDVHSTAPLSPFVSFLLSPALLSVPHSLAGGCVAFHTSSFLHYTCLFLHAAKQSAKALTMNLLPRSLIQYYLAVGEDVNFSDVLNSAEGRKSPSGLCM